MSTTPNERLAAIDVLRGVAVLGILVMNVGTSAAPVGAYFSPALYFSNEGLNRLVFQFQYLVFMNKMMPIFSMLFGAGVFLFALKIDRGEPLKRVRALWLRRCGWLLFFGLIHAYLIWEGDILVPYALLGLLLVWWCRRLRPAWLISIASMLMLVGLAITTLWGAWLIFVLDPEVGSQFGYTPSPFKVEQAVESFVWLGITPEQIDEMLVRMRSDYATIALHRASQMLLNHLLFLPFFGVWFVGGYMLLGLALAKLGVLTGKASARAYTLLTILGYAIGVSASIAILALADAKDWNVGWTILAMMPLTMIAGPVTALGHIGLVMLLVKRNALGWLGTCLQAAGRMAFTNYIAQSLLMTFVFYGYGFGLYGYVDRFGQMVFVLGVWLLQLAWSPLWLAHFRYGPLEWLWRCLTYWKILPISRASAG
ncbi:MAG: DUF418 domain-containing protein [Planctomycetota bacterium]